MNDQKKSTWLRSTLRRFDQVQRRLRFRIAASPINPWAFPTLDASIFIGKSVVIVGPAKTVVDDIGKLNLDEYDVVVRLNNGIALAEHANPALGTRTDILFHNLTEQGERSAGAIPLSLLEQKEVRFLVFPHWGFKGSKTRLYKKREELRYSNVTKIVVLPTKFCEQIRQQLDGNQPTVGTSAMLFFLTAECKEVAIHGFTFFETPYLAGYNDAIKTRIHAQAWAEKSQVHDPGKEKVLVAKYVSEARSRGRLITLGKNVRKTLFGEAADL